MSKSFQILAFYALLLVFAQSLSSFETEKISFNSGQIQYKSNELIDLSETIEIRVNTDSEYYKEMVVGYNGTFVFTSEFKDDSKRFDPETIEKETSFTTFMVEENQNKLKTTCRLWKPEDVIIIICDANFNEKGTHSVRIENQSFEYKDYLIKIIFDGKENFIFEQVDQYFAFIYSRQQNININEDQSSYELKFKFDTYYNEPMNLYGTKNKVNNLFLENCEKIDKELICKISKEKIEEILIFKNEEFAITIMDNIHGKYYCNHVYPIMINYGNVQKEEIVIKLEKVLGGITESLTPVAFETNVKEIPNLITDKVNVIENAYYSYFKKMSGRNLMLISQYNETKPIPSSENEITLDKIHYKYIFKIQPFQFEENITIQNSGAIAYHVFPEKIDFNSGNSVIIRFDMHFPSYDSGIKLNPDSESFLDCEDLEKIRIKKCVVPVSHFNGMKSGNYNIYHKNHAGDLNIYYDLPLINVVLPEENIKEIYIEKADNQLPKYIGYQGTLNFVLDFNDSEHNIFNASDLEEKSSFKTTIEVNETDIYNVSCKLWKPIDEKLNMFCKLNNNLTEGVHSFNLSTSYFYYDKKKYFIFQRESLNLYQMSEKLPFIYSSKQTLNIDENIKTYYLTFKFTEYNNESFMMLGEGIGAVIILDECSVEGKELKCKIDKDIIEEYSSNNGQQFSIYYNFPHIEGDILSLDNNIRSVYGVCVNYSLQKKDISIETIKLLEDKINMNDYIAYETNIKDISNVHSKSFKLTLSNGNETDCSLKKTTGISLTIICLMLVKEGEYSLSKIENKIELNDINIKYNFIIQPINNNEKFTISGVGGFMMFSIPKVLDFTSCDSINVDFGLFFSDSLKGIRLNPEANDLECSNINSIYKRCTVPKNHFRNKDTGYYYTHHANHNNKSIIFYESSPLKVILPENDIYISIKKENNKEKIFLARDNGVFGLVTDYKNEKKIFNSNDNITFVGEFVNERYHYRYSLNCRLWVPNNDNLRIICKNKDARTFQHSDLYLLDIEVTYKDYTIIFEQNDVIEFELSNKYISFLYSERQIINISNETSYELKFKSEAYNKDPLYIYGSNNNYAILNDCNNNTSEITCKISKEKIEEILVNKNEQFKIGAMNEDLGVISFENILDITINYENAQRQDIYLEIKEIIGGTTKIGIPIGLVTNVTDIPNFISAKFDDMKYFKKVSGRPLILFYNYSFEIEYDMKSNYTEKGEVINDIHYKYIFRIQPSKFEGNISVKEKGSNILLSYPQELSYSDEEEEIIKIMYIMNEPQNILDIRLIEDEKYNLECSDLNKMKVCKVPKSHFKEKQSGNYNTSYYQSPRYRIYYDISPINVTKPFEINIIEDSKDIYIGDKGKLYLKTDYNDTERNVFNDTNIEENTKFKISFSNGEKKYSDISCNLWKNTENIIYIFCQLKENLNNNINNINISKTKFVYNKLEINIKQLSNQKLKFVQLEKSIPFLYSKSQTINLEEGKETYYLKFNVENYQNEKIIIRLESAGFIILDKCSVEKKELVCPIDKSELEEYYFIYDDYYLYYAYSGQLFIPIRMIDKIIINKEQPKIDLKITITKLLENEIDIYNYITYEVETNVKNISNLKTYVFSLNFTDTNKNTQKLYCSFKKATGTPLYLLCHTLVSNNISLSLSKIGDEIILKNIHDKYNFYIQPVDYKDIINIESFGGSLALIMPKTINFYFNDTISVEFSLEGYKNESIRSIKFNPNAEDDLVCEDLNHMKKCQVPKSHFENKQSGYYNMYHSNHLGKYIKFYEYSPIQVIFPNDNETIIKIENNKDTPYIGQKGFVSFVTDFKDTEKIFNATNIEKETENKMTFSSGSKNYQANCHLWKLKSEELKLICKFEESINAQTIKLNKFSFTYNEKNITLVCEKNLYINQLNSNVSFLYSDKQEINITENVTEYKLAFKTGVYNKEPLILYHEKNNNKKSIFLNCVEETNEIKCSLSKDNLVGILSKGGNEFGLSQLTESEGILKFENVLDIKINYPNVVKKDIYLNITKLLTQTVEINNYIAFETNITDIQIITTDIFTISQNTITNDNNLECLFKKISNQKDDKLLLLCIAHSSGEYQLNINEKALDDINILYTFKIPKVNISEKINVMKNEGTKILSVYPDSLDFNTQENLTIKYQSENPEKLIGIKLNNDSTTELECKNRNNIKECTVPQSHFKESGNYYTYYNNSLGNKIISYEIPKIQVTLKKKEDGGSEPSKQKNLVGIIVGSVVGGLALIAAIVIIIIFVRKRKKNSSEIITGGSNILPNSNQVELVEGNKFGNE